MFHKSEMNGYQYKATILVVINKFNKRPAVPKSFPVTFSRGSSLWASLRHNRQFDLQNVVKCVKIQPCKVRKFCILLYWECGNCHHIQAKNGQNLHASFSADKYNLFVCTIVKENLCRKNISQYGFGGKQKAALTQDKCSINNNPRTTKLVSKIKVSRCKNDNVFICDCSFVDANDGTTKK